MKSYIKKHVANNEDDFEKKLTVGMIVKNEEAVLRRCLESLSKLRDKLNTEIIITDTGSTDSSVAIAKEFADTITHFEWRNDFSAARNVALDIAVGEWFLMIDADEWLNDELINSISSFINSVESKSYNTLITTIRNYSNKSFTQYIDTFVPRIFRMSLGERYQNPIHETITDHQPSKCLNGIIEHTGYIYKSNKEKRAKTERNNLIIKEYLKNEPNNPSILISYFQSAPNNEKDEITLRMKALISPDCSYDAYNSLTMPRIEYLVSANRLDEAATELDEYFSSRSDAYFIDSYYWASLVYTKIGAYDRALTAIDNYFNNIEKYSSSSKTMNFSIVKRSDIISRADVVRAAIKCSVELKDGKRIVKYFKMQPLEPDNCAELSSQMLAVHSLSICDEALMALYESLLEMSDCDEKNGALNRFCSYVLSDCSNPDTFRALQVTNSLFPISILYNAIITMNFSLCEKITSETAKKQGIMPLFLLVQLMSGDDVSKALEKTTLEELIDYCVCLYSFSDLALIADKLKLLNVSSLKVLNFRINLSSKVLNLLNSDEKKAEIASLLIDDLKNYTHKTYSKELIAEFSQLLPEQSRFAISLERAEDTSDREYLTALRAALTDCPGMKDIAETLLKNFENKIACTPKAQPTGEFTQLAAQIKASIPSLIAAGQTGEAVAVLQKLKSLVPDDKEIDELLFKCSQI